MNRFRLRMVLVVLLGAVPAACAGSGGGPAAGDDGGVDPGGTDGGVDPGGADGEGTPTTPGVFDSPAVTWDNCLWAD